MKGHLRQRGNVWYLVVELERGPDGKRRQQTIRLDARTKREADRERIEELSRIQRGLFVTPARLTVSEYLERWLKDYVGNLKPNTQRTYASLIKAHVLPLIGTMRLQQVRPTDIERIRAATDTAGLSAATRRLVHTILGNAMKRAVRWELIARNPVDVVDPPPMAGKPPKRTYSREQLGLFLGGFVESEARYRILASVLLLTGLRIGEALALRWADVNWDTGQIEVRGTRALKHGPDTEIGTPKTETSRRIIAAPPSAIEGLRAWRSEQGRERAEIGRDYQNHFLIFTDATGAPLKYTAIRVVFTRAAERANVPNLTPHELRHSHATILLAMGEHPKKVQERLGHSSLATTMDTYSHVLPEMDVDLAGRLDVYLADPQAKADQA